MSGGAREPGKTGAEEDGQALVGFAGIGGPEIALREAGIEATGVEIDAAIAEVNRRNGGHCLTADILTLNAADFVGWLLFHFSPPCPSFSVANHASSESELDIALARKICEFIRVGRPEYFTLENVWQYRKSLSWLLIWYTLQEEGYGVDAWNLNAADYSVPQSRRRMIVIARRDGRRPAKPWPTHSKSGDLFTKPWNGWYEAIEDLIPYLPESQLAPWQQDKRPDELRTFLLGNGRSWSTKSGIKSPVANIGDPVPTITGESGGRLRAFILGQGQRSQPKGADEPADTVTANGNQTGIKAVIMASQNTGANNGKGTIRREDQPMFTVVANAFEKYSPPKAVIIDDSRILPIKSDELPVFTITASHKKKVRACLASGRVVSMTVRCLARFQDFPDWFVLPGDPGLVDNPTLLADKRTDRELGCRGIGNALPPGVYRAVLGSLGIEEKQGGV